MTEHDLAMSTLNGEWEIREGLRSAREHPEKARVYEVEGCILEIMEFPEKACAMFRLPPITSAHNAR